METAHTPFEGINTCMLAALKYSCFIANVCGGLDLLGFLLCSEVYSDTPEGDGTPGKYMIE